MTEERVAGLAVLATGVLVLVIYGAGLKQIGFAALSPSAPAKRWPPPSKLLVTLVPAAMVLAIGLSPYVGLRTENSLSMYSNLRTESDRGNHWFVPQGAKVADTQEDLITVVDGGEQIPAVLRGATKLDLTLDRVSFTEADLAVGCETTVQVRPTRPPSRSIKAAYCRATMTFVTARRFSNPMRLDLGSCAALPGRTGRQHLPTLDGPCCSCWGAPPRS